MNIKKTKKSMNLMPYIVLTIVVIGSYIFLNSFSTKINKMDYNELTKEIENNNVKELVVTPKNAAGVYILSGKLNNYGKGETFTVTIPYTDTVVSTVYELAESHNLKVQTNTNPENSTWLTIVVNVVPIIIFGVLAYIMIAKLSNNGKGTFDFSKSRAKLSEDGGTKTFKDVAGLKEEKEEVQELIDFLKNPKKFTSMGARIPKGVLLVGQPGTGKTLLAKAVAGEAGVPFFIISGSDFVEMFVGVGASRVRDLFKQAIAAAPCIIFIDEIDAIGKSRDSQFGGNDEREQTLNQLLSEMDGFDSSKGVLILAATNRPEVLDKALLRPGRFDRRIIVDKPDLKGRLDTLKVHSKDVLMDESVDLEAIALATAGAVGSDLANIINEAAINAVKHHRRAVNQEDLFESVEVVIAGKEKKDRILGKEEKKMVAYHEVGHALVTALTKDAEPVQKITIVPRTMGSLGYTMQVPEEEKYLYKKEELEAKILTLLGGRAAEEIIFGTMTTGASNDIERATKLARTMISQYGMSDRLGIAGFEAIENKYLDGKTTLNCSDKTAAVIDEEVIKMLKESYIKTKGMLQNNLECLHKVSEYLLEKESITGKEFMEIVNSVKNKNEESDNND